MAKTSRTWKLVVTTIIISLVILAAFTAIFVSIIVPTYDITKEQIYSILTRIFPILIGLVLIEIALVVGKGKDDDFSDNIDKLSPNAYDMLLYTPAVDDPMARGNITAGEVFNRVKQEAAEEEKVREIVKEVPVEVVKEVVKEVPVETVKEVPVEVIREVPYPVYKTVPVEVVKEIVKQVPVEVVKEVPVALGEGNDGEPKVIVKEVERPVPVIKEVPVEVIKEVIREVPVASDSGEPQVIIKEVEVPVEVIKEVPVEVIKEVIKEVPVEVVKEVPVEVPGQTVERVVEVQKSEAEPVFYNFRETLQTEMDRADKNSYDLCLAAFDGTDLSRIERYLGADTLLFSEDGLEFAILPYFKKEEAERATRLLGVHAVAEMGAKYKKADALVREARRSLK